MDIDPVEIDLGDCCVAVLLAFINFQNLEADGPPGFGFQLFVVLAFAITDGGELEALLLPAVGQVKDRYGYCRYTFSVSSPASCRSRPALTSRSHSPR